jgi:hypothetical protein
MNTFKTEVFSQHVMKLVSGGMLLIIWFTIGIYVWLSWNGFSIIMFWDLQQEYATSLLTRSLHQ